MKFLVDTNVISEVQHPEGDPAVKVRFLALLPESVFTSAVVFGELTKGISAMAAGKRKRQLGKWLHRFENEFGDRILPFDRDAARHWGNLVAECERRGQRLSIADGQIAATAIQHGMAVITRNSRHFHATGVKVWNIWKEEACA